MTNRMQMFYCLKMFDKHFYHFRPFVNYEIKGYCLLNKDFKDEYFLKFYNDLIKNYLYRMSNGSKEI